MLVWQQQNEVGNVDRLNSLHDQQAPFKNRAQNLQKVFLVGV